MGGLLGSSFNLQAQADCSCTEEINIEIIEDPNTENLNIEEIVSLFQRSAEQGRRWQEQHRSSQQYNRNDYTIKKETLLSRLRYDKHKRAFLIYDKNRNLIGFALVSTFKTWSLNMRFADGNTHNFPLEESYRETSEYPADEEGEAETLEHLVFPNIMELSLLSSDGSIQGVGRLLTLAIKNYARGKNYKFIILEAKAPAIEFYKKFGFNEILLTSDQKHRNGKSKKHKDVKGAPYIHWSYPEEVIDMHENNPSFMMLSPIHDDHLKRKRESPNSPLDIDIQKKIKLRFF
jgi:hypothetical protein